MNLEIDVVDRLLLEKGVYLPADLLMELGYMSLQEYLDWILTPDRDYLERVNRLPIDEVHEKLAIANAYAEVKTAPAKEYSPFLHSGKSFCRDRECDRQLYRVIFFANEDHPSDDEICFYVPDIKIKFLLASWLLHPGGQGTELFDEFKQKHSKYPWIKELHLLSEARRKLHDPVVQNPKIEIECIENTLAPIARKVFGKNAEKFLSPMWKRLSDFFNGKVFDPKMPKMHKSFTDAQAGDWQGTKESIEHGKDWKSQPELLLRWAIACHHSCKKQDASNGWCELFWRFPSDAAQAMNAVKIPDPTLVSLWKKFEDFDDEMNAQDFPAFIMIHKRSWFGRLEEINLDHCPDSTASSFSLVRRLVSNPESIEVKKELKHANEKLFHAILPGMQ